MPIRSPHILRFLPLLLLPILVLAVSSRPASGATVTLDDVASMLKAGVGESIILEQAGSAGISFTLGVPEILKLKEAGASDRLLESLMKLARSPRTTTAESAAGAPSDSPAYRIYREKTSDGEEVLHVTNLDPSGRRMGGEVFDDGAVNRVDTSGPAFTGDSGPRQRDYEVIGDREPQPPVVVNVFPPDSGPPAGYVAESPYIYRDPYAYRYVGGILPGYRTWGYGRPAVWAPPGSWTHYRLYHGEGASAPPSRFGNPFPPIGPAIGYDMYYRHTQQGYRR